MDLKSLMQSWAGVKFDPLQRAALKSEGRSPKPERRSKPENREWLDPAGG
jgi:hypothetical protein